MPDLVKNWQARLEPAVCEHCDWRFLLPAGSPAQRCPHCFHQELVPLDPDEELRPFPHRPELVVPFSVTNEQVAQQVTAFARSIPYAPADLKADALQRRLRRVFLPQWLVDAQVQAQLQMEAGYDYQVVSHREQYENGQWQTQEVKETRVRWELRLGQLQRDYHNIPAPALEEETLLQQRLGDYRRQEAIPYDPACLDQSFVHLPDRPPEDAWVDAVPVFQEAAAEECRQAAEAQHQRDFQWSPAFSNQQWTQLLRPLYTTYYLDDERRPRPVLIHGQTGRVYGERRASARRARRITFVVGGIAAAFFMVALVLGVVALLDIEDTAAITVLVFLFATLLALVALIPPAHVWYFNRQQRNL